ncbi:hypothetical protein NUW58_g142 [Xylaria curta]|uniref:Uncharacterized protein n=1 Tax=Xylaria curta TaxID=42375 RepID=A0ACC1PQG4_9PEZI|nr:hypothetical protein NUW58_g142 [Xylaria curta]
MSATTEAPPAPLASDDLGRGPGILGATWFLVILTIFIVSARIYVRKKFRILGLDDWLMVAAVVLQITSQGLLTYQYQWGFGKRDKYLSFDPQIVTILKYQWISSLPNILISVIARISAVLMLIKIFGSKPLKLYSSSGYQSVRSKDSGILESQPGDWILMCNFIPKLFSSVSILGRKSERPNPEV